MLDAVPADALGGEAPMLQYVDMELVWDRLELADAGDEERLAELGSAASHGTFALPPRLFDVRAFDVEASREEVGFDVLAIEREIAVDSPPSALRVLDVTVAEDDIAAATAEDPTWSDRRQTVETDAGEYFDWSTDGDELAVDVERTTPMRPLGVGGQLAVEGAGDGARVVRTVESAWMEDALATAAGEAVSAAEEGPFTDAADALDGDVMQAAGIVGPISGLPAGLTPEQEAAVESRAMFVEPYTALLVADVVVDEEPRLDVLLLHDSADEASANEAAVAELVADGVTAMNIPVAELLPDATVEVDGNVVRVSSVDGRFGQIFNALLQRAVFVSR